MIHLPVHSLFEALAYTAGFRYFLKLRKETKDTISTENRIWILTGAVAGAFVFSRLVSAFEDPAVVFSGKATFYYYLTNKTIVGGLLGGWIGVEIVKKWIGIKTSSGDLMTYPIILGLMIGRVGCFLTGLDDGTYGLESHLPWAVDLGDGIRRHPVPIYEILFLLLLWISLKALERNRPLADGYRFKLFMAGYLLFRFWVEFLKPRHPLIWDLSSIQLAALAGLTYCAVFFINPWRAATISTTT